MSVCVCVYRRMSRVPRLAVSKPGLNKPRVKSAPSESGAKPDVHAAHGEQRWVRGSGHAGQGEGARAEHKAGESPSPAAQAGLLSKARHLVPFPVC